MVGLRQCFIAAGCNRSSLALGWGSSGLIAYAAHNAVAIYDPQASCVTATLLGHAAVVQCLTWLPLGRPGGLQFLASGDGAGQVRLWCLEGSRPACVATLQAAGSPLSSLAAERVGEGMVLVATSADPSTAWVWVPLAPGPDGSWELPRGDNALALTRRETHSGRPMAHTAALYYHDSSETILLALGTVEGASEIYTAPAKALAADGSPGFTPATRLDGHTDWVRGLAWTGVSDGRLLLASAGQDRYIRVWTLTPVAQGGQATVDDAAALAGQHDHRGAGAVGTSTADSVEAMLTRFAPKPAVSLADGSSLVASLEALLVGHEDWVLSVAWKPGQAGETPVLLSASMDRSMMIWQADISGLWLSRAALGDAGANHLGYYSCAWAPDGRAVATHGYTGSLHIWRVASNGGWEPMPAPSGHMAGVVDAAWAGDCLLTVSADQTARCWARCGREDRDWREIARPQVHGHDFHGLAVLQPAAGRTKATPAAAGKPAGSAGPDDREHTTKSCPEFCYASCSEEKVIRIFVAPRAFLASLPALGCTPGGVHPIDTNDLSSSTTGNDTDELVGALGAMLPALGLSNKAVYEDEETGTGANGGVDGSRGGQGSRAPLHENAGPGSYAAGPDFAPSAAPRALRSPPLEEALSQSTLWPEARKLYGHGSEVATLAAHPSGRWLASAALSSGGAARTAAVWIWDADRRFAAAHPPLEAHTLTITRLAFSPNGGLLASVGRDRTLALWQLRKGVEGGCCTVPQHLPSGSGGESPATPEQQPFELVTRVKAGSRVLYDVAWAPDGVTLATASRDGTIAFWRVQYVVSSETSMVAGAAAHAITLNKLYESKQDSPVRAVAFGPAAGTQSSPDADADEPAPLLVAVGLEDGRLRLLRCGPNSAVLEHEQEAHAAPVQRLAWHGDDDCSSFLLASCALDGAVRIWTVPGSPTPDIL